jgi:hypothetical protein
VWVILVTSSLLMFAVCASLLILSYIHSYELSTRRSEPQKSTHSGIEVNRGNLRVLLRTIEWYEPMTHDLSGLGPNWHGWYLHRRAPHVSPRSPWSLGFRFHVSSDTPVGTGGDMSIQSIVIPLWSCLLLAAVAPLWCLTHWRQTVRRIRNGLCRHCGYDLRVTHGRCPECGAPQKQVRTNQLI